MCAGKSDGRGEQGFTLVEVLVALTLLAFVSLMLFGGLRFGARTWEAVVVASEQRDRIAAAQGFLRDRLSTTTNPGGRRARDTLVAIDLNGDADRLSFVSPWMTSLAQPGLYRFTLWHDAEGDGQLVLEWQPAGLAAAEGAELEGLRDRRVLLEGVDAVGFRYYGAVAPDEPPAWLNHWQTPELAPLLVEIEVTLDDPVRAWPRFVAEIRS